MTQRVLITAGAGGIGLAVARAFHAAGGRIAICDIDEAALSAAARQLPGLHVQRCDVGDRGAVAGMVAAAVAQLGGLDVLVNNAGIERRTRAAQDL